MDKALAEIKKRGLEKFGVYEAALKYGLSPPGIYKALKRNGMWSSTLRNK